MESRSLAREVALLVLGQISQENIQNYQAISLEKMLDLGLDTLGNHWREQLDDCALQIELAQEGLSKIDFEQFDQNNISNAQKYLANGLEKSENILNLLSDTFELAKLLTLSDQENIRIEAMNRIDLVVKQFNIINSSLDKATL